MTKILWMFVKNKNLFHEDYQGRTFPKEVFEHTKPETFFMMDFLQSHFDVQIIPHVFWSDPTDGGHVTGSQHYNGTACDFHFKSRIQIPFHKEVILFIERLKILGLDKLSIGIYPDWNYPGYHIDTRLDGRRWGRIGSEYYNGSDGFNTVLEYARKKEKGRRD